MLSQARHGEPSPTRPGAKTPLRFVDLGQKVAMAGTNKPRELTPLVGQKQPVEGFDWHAEKQRIESEIEHRKKWNNRTLVSGHELDPYGEPLIALPVRGQTKNGEFGRSSRLAPTAIPPQTQKQFRKQLGSSLGSSILSQTGVREKPSEVSGRKVEKVYGNMGMARKVLGKEEVELMGRKNSGAPGELEDVAGASSWELVQALFQDTGAGDGSWRHANPRALELLPTLLLSCGKITYLVKIVTNLHFLLQKALECGVACVRNDLQSAEEYLRTYVSRPKAGGEVVEAGVAADMHKRVRDFLLFVNGNVAHLAQNPKGMFSLALTQPRGSAVLVDANAAVDRLERTMALVESLLDPMTTVPNEHEPEAVARLLIARAHLRVCVEQGLASSMGDEAMEKIETAELRIAKWLVDLRASVQGSVEHLAEKLGVCVCSMLGTELDFERPAHWENDAVFALIAEALFDEYAKGVQGDGDEVFVNLTLAPSGGLTGPDGRAVDDQERNWEVLQRLTVLTGAASENLSLLARGSISTLRISGGNKGWREDTSHGESGLLGAGEEGNVPEQQGKEGAAQVPREEKLAMGGLGAGSKRVDAIKKAASQQKITEPPPAGKLAWGGLGSSKKGLQSLSRSPSGVGGEESSEKTEGDAPPGESDAAGEMQAAEPHAWAGWSEDELAAAEEGEGWQGGLGPRQLARLVMEQAMDENSFLRESGFVAGAGVPTLGWREARVFVASGICDIHMQAERRMLTRFVLPALRSACRARRIRFSWVLCQRPPKSDLELSSQLIWASECTVPLPDGRDMPLSIGFFGGLPSFELKPGVKKQMAKYAPDVFGWVGDEQHKTYTQSQLEISQSYLRGGQEAASFVFVRDPAFMQDENFKLLPMVVQKIFEEPGEDERAENEAFLNRLEQRAAATGHGSVTNYTPRFLTNHDGQHTGDRASIRMAGVFDLGMKVYASLWSVIDAVCPVPSARTPREVEAEKQQEHAMMLHLHASEWAAETRLDLLNDLLNFVERGGGEGEGGDLLVSLEGGPGSGRTTVLARLMVELVASGVLAARGARAVYVSRESWTSRFSMLETLLTHICNSYHEGTEVLEEFVGEASWQSVEAALEAMSGFGQEIVLVIDGISESDVTEVCRVFHNLQKRRPLIPVGGNKLGQEVVKVGGDIRIVVSTSRLETEEHRNVRVLHMLPLTDRERFNVCKHTLERAGAGTLPLDDHIRKLCSKRGAADPRYLEVAVVYMLQTLRHLPGQLQEIVASLPETLMGLYERSVLPLLEDVSGEDAVSRTLLCVCGSAGMLPAEIRWALADAGLPADDAVLLSALDMCMPYAQKHEREDSLFSIACTQLKRAVLNRYSRRAHMTPAERKESRRKQKEAENLFAAHKLRAEMSRGSWGDDGKSEANNY